MNLKSLTLAAATLITVAATPIPIMARENPFLKPYDTKFDIPPFEQIQTSDFIPAIEAGVKEMKQSIFNIVRNRAVPDFDNTILPLENLSPIMDRVRPVFYHYQEALSTPEFAAMADKAIPLLNEADNMLMLDDQLFQRIKSVYDARDKQGMTPEQKRLTEKYYRQYVEAGATLSPEKKKELIAINDELSKLFIQFNRNLLQATNNFYITVSDPKELSGLPENAIGIAAKEAEKRGLKGKWVFTLHNASRLPVLQNADSRKLREQIYKGYTTLATTGATSNLPVIAKIVKLRKQKATVMGFKTFADMMTSRVMAKTPDAALNLLMQVFTPAVERSKAEVADMQAYADKAGDKITIEPWDYYYYANKVKKQKYDIDENEVRQYFPLDQVMKGLFTAAERLWGIRMVELKDAPKYMDEVKVFEVQDAKTGEHVAVFMCDYFPRDSKRQGAWMEALKGGGYYADGKFQAPIIYNVGNFTPPAGNDPALLTIDEVETVFHEFGHALQGMLTKPTYRSLFGTDVDRDFVEMCSQINEHWAFSPELLKEYARHYKTGAPIPDELVKKIQDASKFNQGFVTTELAGAALLDMYWGMDDGENVDVIAFEKQIADKIGMPKEITYRYRSPYFKHIFGDDGYASGYYTYLWAQVLEADAFELFEQKGIFDPATAASFKNNILRMGDIEDAMELFIRFRGRKPDAKALLRLRGFIE